MFLCDCKSLSNRGISLFDNDNEKPRQVAKEIMKLCAASNPIDSSNNEIVGSRFDSMLYPGNDDIVSTIFRSCVSSRSRRVVKNAIFDSKFSMLDKQWRHCQHHLSKLCLVE